MEISDLQEKEAQIRRQGAILDAFFQHSVNPLVILDKDFNFIRMNAAYAQACNRETKDFIGKNHFDLYPSDARDIFEEVVSSKKPYQTTARPFVFADHPEWGVTYWDWTLVPILDPQGEVEFLVFSINDVTANQRGQLELHRANRALRTLSAGSKAVMQAGTEAELLPNVCRAVVEEGGYRLAWIGYAEKDRQKTVRPMAQAGYEEGYLETLKITWADKKRGQGPTGAAIRTGQPALARDILTDPHFSPWRREARKRGYASSLVLPLIAEGKAFGALNIYAQDADAFDRAEVQLLSDLAANVSFGIMALRAREEQRRLAAALRRSFEELEARVQDRTQQLAQSNAALQNEIAERLWSEKKLQESEERYRRLVDQSPDAIAVQSQGRFLFVNPAGVRLFGANHYRDLVGKEVPEVIHPDYRHLVTEHICKVNAEGARTDLREIQILRLDGQVVEVEASGVGVNFQGQPAVQMMLRDISRRRKMEKALEHQASFPRLNPNPVLEVDYSGNITFANAAALAILENLGLENQTRAFLPPDLDILTEIAEGEGGTVFCREVEISGVFFEESIHFPEEFQAIRIYARDITLQKRAEMERQEFLEKLQASEEELQVINEELQVQNEELQTQAEELLATNQDLHEAHYALGESQRDLNRAQAVAHTGSWRLNMPRNELLWSEETYRIFGIPQGKALTYETFLAAVHPEDREYVDQKWNAALGGAPYDIEHRIVADEVVKWVREKAELEFDSQGQLRGGFGTVQDITAHKQAEEAVKESEERYRSMFENNQAAMLLLNPETGGIVDANPAACFFYGYDRDEMIAKKLRDISLVSEDQILRNMQRVKFGEAGHFFFKHRLATGEVREVEIYSGPILVHGRLLLYSIIHDNSARKEAEVALQTSRDFLEIANRHTEMTPLLLDYVAAIQEHVGCEAAAIRILDEQGNIPYEAHTGFSEEFIASEGPLCLSSDQCLCINVIKGATDPSLPCYTKGASCYINDFSEVLATIPRGRLGETRDVCHHFGYESVALVPIRFGGEILGLIHLADHRQNVVPLALVTRLERIALTLGTAIHRVRVEEALRQTLAEARQRQAEIEALLQATRAVLKSGSFTEIARSIFDSCKGLIGASSGYVALLTPDGQENDVLFLDTAGLSCQVDPSLPMPIRGLRAEAYRNCRTVFHNDFANSEYAAFLPLGHVVLDNILFSPLVVKEKTVGLLGLGNKPGGFTAEDARLAAGFGELAAMALAGKRAEEERERLIWELETERARLQAIIASAPEAIVVADADGRLVLTNPAADQLYAKPLENDADLESCALFQLCQGDGTVCVPGNQPLIRSAKAGDTHRNLEMVLAWPNGQRRDLLVNTAPIVDEHGRRSGAVGLFQDITRRKRVEKKIHQLNLELSDRIREASEHTRQLEAANKELEAFSYSVSHDLRAPLRAIDGFARILLEEHGEKLAGEGMRLLDVIRSNTRIMGDLIDDLLAFSRLGRQEIRAQKINVAGLVTSIFRELRARDPQRQMELIMNSLPPAYGDRNLINQVLTNLLENACKFTKSREKTVIEVDGWTEGKEDIYSVKDNGVGFDMRYVDKIFGVFQRLHRREEFEGTGVGLAIVQRIISRHGGRVWATGKVDGGAIFYFALPRKGEAIVG